MHLFLDSLKSVQKLWKGKRKSLGQEQESPAKKSKVQATHMLNSHKSSQAGGDTIQGAVDPQAAATTTGRQLASHQPQQQQELGLQQLPSSMPLVAPRQLMQHQHATAAPESYYGVKNTGFEQVQRTLARPPIATAQRQQAAQARSKIAQQRQVFQHLQGSQVHLLTPQGNSAHQQHQQQQQQPRPLRGVVSLLHELSQSPLTWRCSPQLAPPNATSRPRPGSYGTMGPPPQQQQQQERLRPARTAANPPGLHSLPTRATMTSDVTEPALVSNAARRSASPPVQAIRQRLSYGAALEREPAGGTGRNATAGSWAAGDAGAASGSGGVTPGASFAAAYERTSRDLGLPESLGDTGADPLEARSQELVARTQALQAKLMRERQKSQDIARRSQQTCHSIDRSLHVNQDYQPNLQHKATRAAWQQLEAQAVAEQQQRLQRNAELQQELQQQRLQHQQVLAAAAARAAELHTPAQAARQQGPQEDQPLEVTEEPDGVVIVSDDESQPAGSGQQYSSGEADGTDEGLSRGDQQESEEESEEAEEAAAGIKALEFSSWQGPRANWRCTKEQLERFKRATEGAGNDQEVLASHDRTSLALTRQDLSTMRAAQWLNDECMNMYMALLQDRDSSGRAAGGLRCHFFNTFFLNKLYADDGKYAYNKVRRWTLPSRLKTAGQASDCVLKCDRLIFPVHQGCHWTALMVDLQQQRVVFFDSLLGRNTRAVEEVKKWVADEAKDKLKETWDTSSWQEVYPQDIPRQLNGYDCGVFALMFCNRLGLKAGSLDFTQDDISLSVRVAITCDMLDGSIQATGQRD